MLLHNSNTICVNMAVVCFFIRLPPPLPPIFVDFKMCANFAQNTHLLETILRKLIRWPSAYFLFAYLPHKTLNLKIKHENRNICVNFFEYGTTLRYLINCYYQMICTCIPLQVKMRFVVYLWVLFFLKWDRIFFKLRYLYNVNDNAETY